jgi:hypothetical protein
VPDPRIERGIGEQVAEGLHGRIAAAPERIVVSPRISEPIRKASTPPAAAQRWA